MQSDVVAEATPSGAPKVIPDGSELIVHDVPPSIVNTAAPPLIRATQSLLDGHARAVRYEDEAGKLPAVQELPPSVEKAAPSPFPCPPTTTQTDGAGQEAAWGLETAGGAELGLQVVPPSLV